MHLMPANMVVQKMCKFTACQTVDCCVEGAVALCEAGATVPNGGKRCAGDDHRAGPR